MTDKLEFPIKGTEDCPACGSTKRIAEQTIKQLKEDNRLPKEAFSKGCVLQVPLFAPMGGVLPISPTIKIPVLLIYYDICAECFAIYCTGAELVEQTATMQMRQRPMPPGTRQMPNLGGSSKPF